MEHFYVLSIFSIQVGYQYSILQPISDYVNRFPQGWKSLNDSKQQIQNNDLPRVFEGATQPI